MPLWSNSFWALMANIASVEQARPRNALCNSQGRQQSRGLGGQPFGPYPWGKKERERERERARAREREPLTPPASKQASKREREREREREKERKRERERDKQRHLTGPLVFRWGKFPSKQSAMSNHSFVSSSCVSCSVHSWVTACQCAGSCACSSADCKVGCLQRQKSNLIDAGGDPLQQWSNFHLLCLVR